MREIRCGASSHILVEPYSQHRCCCCSSEASSRQMLLPPFTGATAGQIASPCYQAVLVSGGLKTDKDGKISRVYFTDTVYCMYMPNQTIFINIHIYIHTYVCVCVLCIHIYIDNYLKFPKRNLYFSFFQMFL